MNVTGVRRGVTVGLALLVAGALSMLAAPHALAACHVAAFMTAGVEGEEGSQVALTVTLRGGQPSCSGTVEYRTVDGTAVAGEDYEAAEGTLTYEEGDDRVEEIVVVLLADDAAEDTEEFTVEIGPTTGSIASTSGPATVLVIDAQEGEAPGATDEPTTPADSPADTPTAAADEAAAGGSPWPLVLAVVVLLGMLGLLAAGWARRR